MSDPPSRTTVRFPESQKCIGKYEKGSDIKFKMIENIREKEE